MNEKQLKDIFKQGGTITTWKPVLDFAFGKVEYFTKPDSIFTEDKKVVSGKQAGRIKLDDGRSIALFEVQVDDSILIERNRQGLREIAAKYIDQDISHGALVFYHSPQQETYRLTFIAHWSEINLETGQLQKEETHKKRYTYLLGGKQSGTTIAQRLLELRKKLVSSKSVEKGIALKDVTEAFSVSILTKEFYNELFQWYQWTLSEEVGVTFPKKTNITEDDREKLEEQIIRLVTRLLFVWFIKQKNFVPDTLFDAQYLKKVLRDFDPISTTVGNYYNAILQNLFFATLNKAISKRKFARLKDSRDIKTLYRYAEMFNIPESEILELFHPIPFLNGGLFECLDKEDIEGNEYSLDGFSRNDKKSANGNFKHRAFIPNCVFFDEHKGIIPLLQRYNFTVEEHSPEDVQVALDPELLGNVFENLLGAFNSETKDTARKQSGSFYTPREIVDYMVSEGLIAYLDKNCQNLKPDTIRSLFEKKELPEELQHDETLCHTISDKLKSVKIIDPACGSGAFPMGILKKMVEVLEKLDLNNTKTVYDQKLHLIEECIYGVDIQSIAAQISKLRFFISLICEQKNIDLSKSKENYGVITLPNLETKFVAANTLVRLKKKSHQGNLFEDVRIDNVKQEILNVRHEHFYVKTAADKKLLREKDEKLRTKLAGLLQENDDFAPDDAKQFAQWNPYDQNVSSPFFDPEWMFGVKDGFDIVIGNPPYIQLQKNGGALATQFEKAGYKTFTRTGDIYSLFYEKGVELLKSRGHLIFITSNKWMRAGYGESTRRFFTENTNPILLVDFAGQKIFDAATVDTNILLLSKEKNQQKTLGCVVKGKVLNNLSVFVRQHGSQCVFNTADSWVILSVIEQRIKDKIERIGTPLKEWDIQINYGIKTGFNDAFIITGRKREELIEQDPKSEEIIRPILRGRNIKRYGYDFTDSWLINTHNGIKEKGIKPIDIEDYPAIKEHLDTYYSELKKRVDKGDTPYNLRNCAYMEDFFRPKIIYPEITKFLNFYYDEKSFFTNNKCFILTGDHIEFLTAFFNSKLFKFCFRDSFPELLGGTREIRKIFLEEIRIVVIDNIINNQFKKMVEKAQYLRAQNADVRGIYKQIDDFIFNLYSLSHEEKEIIKLIEIE
jgi:hypothetical protein